MPNQPAGWPITGTTATKPPSEEPKDDHPIEQTLQKRCRGTWQSSQSIQIPSFTKNRMSCCSYISYYFLSININCLSFTWISMAFVTCISGKKFSKSCTFHPSSSKYQNCLNSAKLLVFLNIFKYPGRNSRSWNTHLRYQTSASDPLDPEERAPGPGSRTCGVDSKDFPMETQDPNEKIRLTNSMCKDLVVFLFLKDLAHRIRVKDMTNIFIICKDVDITKMCFQMWCESMKDATLKGWPVEGADTGRVLRNLRGWSQKTCVDSLQTLHERLPKAHHRTERECSNSLKSRQTLKSLHYPLYQIDTQFAKTWDISLPLLCHLSEPQGQVYDPPAEKAGSNERRLRRYVLFPEKLHRYDSLLEGVIHTTVLGQIVRVCGMYETCLYVSMYRCICVSMSLYIYVSMYLCIYVGL